MQSWKGRLEAAFDTRNDDWADAEDIIEYDGQEAKIVGCSVDNDSFRDSYWDIEFEDGSQFGAISGYNLSLLKSINESSTHCVYFKQDGKEQVEFEGTEDECNKYIADIQAEQDDEFGDEAPERFVKKLTEASYGGAFDIEDDQYFTKDDLLYFADEVLGNVAETFDGTYDIGGVWFEDGCVVTQIVDEDGNMYEDTTRVDMRKIKEPWHLKRAYGQQVSANIIQQIKEMSESVVSSSHNFDDDVDDLSYYYDDETFKDNLENSPYTEISSKCMKDRNMKSKTLKLLEENTR